MDQQKRLSPIKIIVIIFTYALFITLNCSEDEDASVQKKIYRDYTLAKKRVVSHCRQDKDDVITENALLSLGNDNELFVCYSGYKIAPGWRCNISGYDYSYKHHTIAKKTNLISIINPHEKIEYFLDTPHEIDNEHSVADIARTKNFYIIAHQNNIYLYNKRCTYTQYYLQQVQQYTYPIADKDSIKKIFITLNDTIIAASSFGAIFESSSINNTVTKISDAFTEQRIPAFAYNAERNIFLFGLTGSVQIVALDSKTVHTINLAANLTINTIDTCSSHILLSNLTQNPDLRTLCKKKGHFASKNCCKDNFRYAACEECKKNLNGWEKNKETYNKETITIVLSGERQNLPKQLKQKLEYLEPIPARCTHYFPANFPDSCLKTTLMLISFDSIIKQINQNGNVSHISLESLDYQRAIHTVEGDHNNFPAAVITHLCFFSNSLLIGIHSPESCGNMSYGNSVYIFPLQNINLSEIPVLKWSCNVYTNIQNFYLYCSAHKDAPIKNHGCPWSLQRDSLTPLQLCKNETNLCITKINNAHKSVHDTVLFSETDNTKNIIIYLKALTKHWLHAISSTIYNNLIQASIIGTILFLCTLPFLKICFTD